MSLDALLTKLEGRAVTPVTATIMLDVTAKPAQTLGCTDVTPVTAKERAVQDSGNKISPAQWDAADWQEFYAERAGVAEYAGGMVREKAEHMAYESCITRWLDTHPPAHTNGTICPHCYKPNGAPGTSCVPTLSGNGGHVWLHRACLDPWRARRRQEAIKALADMGIIRQESSVTTASTPGAV